ncbi:MAG TPA: helix-turn-helix transcriptional regulator [Blastocatellia bacterium]|nr:helix-turn-helix transcriptional regulator [Blastocatellia bacterium]
MRKRARRKPAFLAEKLRRVRKALGASQDTIIPLLGLDDELIRSEISSFERGHREPATHILLAFGKLAGVYIDVLYDDELDLPEKLPAFPKSGGVARKPTTRKKKPQPK